MEQQGKSRGGLIMMVGDDDFAPASHLLDMCKKKEKKEKMDVYQKVV